MKERLVDVPTPDGPMDSFIVHPEEGGPFPAVVIYMDIWGLREELYDIARRIAAVGYYSVMPNVYHRQGKVRFEFRNEAGQMRSLAELDEDTQKEILAPLAKLTNAMVMSDTRALIDFIDAGEPGRTDGMGSVGYCMGGRHVLCAAGEFPDHFKATACLHGTEVISEREDSPHHLIGAFQGEVYCGFGEKDPYAPPELIEELGRLMAAGNVGYSHHVHKDAQHGYALPDRDIFDKQAANRDWERIFAMFHRQIPASFDPGVPA